MLTELHIQDFALIDDLCVELNDGFNVLTGETGAGKSIIIDALNAALGERTPAEVVRSGAEKAVVEAAFDMSRNVRAAERAASLGVELDDGMLVISREISTTGKSQSRVNGRLATASMVRELTADLVDIHGQHEHQSLLAVDRHIDIFDAWCWNDVLTQRAKVAETWRELRALKDQLERVQADARERARMLDLYEFQRTEIERANLQPGEDEELQTERIRLANAERLMEASQAVYAALVGGAHEQGAVQTLAGALRQLELMVELDPRCKNALEAIQTALYAAQDAQAEVRSYADMIEADPERLEAVEERLDLIRTLKKKYGETIEEIISYGQEAARKIREITHSEEIASELSLRIQAAEEKLKTLAEELTRMRRSAAEEFSQAVIRELSELAMEKTRFEVGMEPCSIGEKGAEKIQFLISPNPGEPLKPLAKIASGGEMSRIMLALKTVMAGADRVPTLVFDEIDAGIGGRTALVIGEKLSAIAAHNQVMCVTHLPQIAGKARTHLYVEKYVEGGRTKVRVRRLTESERVHELARMLGGEESETALQHARELLGV